MRKGRDGKFKLRYINEEFFSRNQIMSNVYFSWKFSIIRCTKIKTFRCLILLKSMSSLFGNQCQMIYIYIYIYKRNSL